MSTLKEKNVKRCNSLLSDFINAVTIDDTNHELKKKKENAVLALHHLEKITGGKPSIGSEAPVPCGPRPRIPA